MTQRNIFVLYGYNNVCLSPHSHPGSFSYLHWPSLGVHHWENNIEVILLECLLLRLMPDHTVPLRLLSVASSVTYGNLLIVICPGLML